ncbi:MAG: glycosyl transferase [Muribaculaceae bacterium]|nr:glycosyl transferase [Muribaculaceae bacterium]
MIPKIIHYCWFGGKEKPAEFHKWYKTWQSLLPDYKFMEWNEQNFDINYSNYSREAYLTHNYAHVSDVCRVYALYEYGGVYLDTDVEVIKSFDDFLPLEAFLGVEHEFLGTGVMGSAPRQKWLEAFLGYYKNRHFINLWGHTVRTPNTKILTKTVLPEISIIDYPTIFPHDYFSGMIWETKEIIKTENTVSVHHFAASWRRKKTFKQKITSIIDGLYIRYIKKSS